MHGRNKLFRWLYLPLGAVALLIAAYAILLGASWVRDRHLVAREEFPAHGDYSRLTNSIPQQTIVPDADPAAARKQLQALVRRAATEGRKISVAGSAHSMGGHTLVNGGWRVEMRAPAFQHIDPVRIENGTATVRVGAGVTWHQLLRALDREGWSVAIMQSNDDFTVGGSVSTTASPLTALTTFRIDRTRRSPSFAGLIPVMQKSRHSNAPAIRTKFSRATSTRNICAAIASVSFTHCCRPPGLDAGRSAQLNSAQIEEF